MNIIKKDKFLNTGISSLLFVPLLIWFIFSLLKVVKENSLIVLFFNPINVIFGILFFTFIIYHICSEIDYLIKDNKFYNSVKNIILLINLIIVLLFIISIIKINISSVLVI